MTAQTTRYDVLGVLPTCRTDEVLRAAAVKEGLLRPDPTRGAPASTAAAG